LFYALFELITNIADLAIFFLSAYWIIGKFTTGLNKSEKFFRILLPVYTVAIITIFLKIVIHRQPPSYLHTPWPEFSLLPWRYAFPSGHASRAFALAAALAHEFSDLRYSFFSVALLIGFSRVYIGAHYPADVIGGALLGIFTVWLFSRKKNRQNY
jgi:undecaprenyl-diphosphatase